MQLDYGKFLIWNLSETIGGPFPPYFLEAVMRDGKSFYVHSGNSRDEESNSVVINIYDFRAMNNNDVKKLMKTLEKTSVIPKSPSKLHPLLSYGLLRCKLDDMLYLLQWQRNRVWILEEHFPEEIRRNLGFPLPHDDD